MTSHRTIVKMKRETTDRRDPGGLRIIIIIIIMGYA
jgi:hypothetical protein